MIDHTAIDRLLQAGRDLAAPTVTIGGTEFWADTKRPVFDMENDGNTTINVQTIASFCEYVALASDHVEVVRVESPVNATAIGEAQTEGVTKPYRALIATLVAAPVAVGRDMSSWLNQQDFLETVQLAFEDDENRTHLLQFVAGVQAKAVAKLQTNESIQTVVVKRGVESLDREPVKNPITLTPISPFPGEIKPLPYEYNLIFRNVGDDKLPDVCLQPYGHQKINRLMMNEIRAEIDKRINSVLDETGEPVRTEGDPILVLV